MQGQQYTVLQNNNIHFKEIHIKEAIYNKYNKYVILIRNPISRFISAFNWRYRLLNINLTQQYRFIGEKETIEKYDNVNNLAENIENYDEDREYIHHIKENINFYIGNFLKKM